MVDREGCGTEGMLVYCWSFLADVAFALFNNFILNWEKVRIISLWLQIIQHKEKFDHGGERETFFYFERWKDNTCRKRNI